MQCIAVTRGGLGDLWLFDSLEKADEHALIQYGDALCRGPSDIPKLWSNLELVRIAYRLGEERLALELDGKKRVTEYLERLWNLLVSHAQRPPSDPAEVLRLIALDRQKTRVEGVIQRRHPTEESTKMADEAAATTKTKKAAANGEATTTGPKTAKFPETGVITFGKDNENKTYGPQSDGTFYSPKRAGSAAGNRFLKYKSGMTVKEAMEAGIVRADLNWDTKQGFINIK